MAIATACMRSHCRQCAQPRQISQSDRQIRYDRDICSLTSIHAAKGVLGKRLPGRSCLALQRLIGARLASLHAQRYHSCVASSSSSELDDRRAVTVAGPSCRPSTSYYHWHHDSILQGSNARLVWGIGGAARRTGAAAVEAEESAKPDPGRGEVERRDVVPCRAALAPPSLSPSRSTPPTLMVLERAELCSPMAEAIS